MGLRIRIQHPRKLAMTGKIVCECGWCGSPDDVLIAKHPFMPDGTVYGCPKCKEIETFAAACDEPDCWKKVTCGTSTPSGYRSTCSKHRPETA